MYRDELPTSAMACAASGTEQEILQHGPRSNDSHFGGLDELKAPAAGNRTQTSSLPFVVDVATTEEQLLRIQTLRQSAYGHHLPEMAHVFGAPDPLDRADDAVVFTVEDKSTGGIVGSARIQSNRSMPLPIEASIELPESCKNQSLVEISRLCCLPGYQQPVRMALVKASYLFCIAMQIRGVVASSRHSLVRGYRSLGFSDLYGDERMLPLRHVGGLHHRILFLDMNTFEPQARERGLAAYDFFFRDYHPDIRIFEAVASASARLRAPVGDAQGWQRAA